MTTLGTAETAKRTLASGEQFEFLPADAFAALGGAHIGWKLHINVPDDGADRDFGKTRTIATDLIGRQIPFKIGVGGLASEGKGMTVYARSPDEALAVADLVKQKNPNLHDHPDMLESKSDDLRLDRGIAARFCTHSLVRGDSNALFTRYGRAGIGMVTQDLFLCDPQARTLGNISPAEKWSRWFESPPAIIDDLRMQAHKAHLALFGTFYLTPALADRVGAQLPQLTVEKERLCRRLLPVAVIDKRGPAGIGTQEDLISHPKTRVILARPEALTTYGPLVCLLAALAREPPISAAELPERLSMHGISPLSRPPRQKPFHIN
jgi:hypothetical protein